MHRERSAAALVMAVLLLLAGSAAGVGKGDVCIHLGNGITGPDTALIGFENTLEVWIANDDLLGGISIPLSVSISIPFEWDMEYGSHPPVNEEGRAVGVWNLPDLQIAFAFDNVSPELFLLGGAATPGAGLPAGPSEVCYSLRFTVLEGEPDSSAGVCVAPYLPPVGSWMFTDGMGGYCPNFCGEPVCDGGWSPDTVCFPATVLPWICGDVVRDGRQNISDAVFLVNYVLGAGDAPNPLDLGDADCNGNIEVADVLYLVAYIFGAGPPPCDLDADGAPDC